MGKCSAIKPNGTRCKRQATTSQGFCYSHDPVHAEDRKKTARIAAKAKHHGLNREVKEVKALVGELVQRLVNNDLDFGVVSYLSNLVQLLNTYLRAAELQVRIRTPRRARETGI